MAKAVAFVSTFCLIFLLIGGIAYVRFAGPGASLWRRNLDTPALVREVRQLNQLVTVKYSVEKVIAVKEERRPLGSESMLLLVEARVLAGVDLAELTQYDVAMPSSHEARIRLKPARIFETFLDEKSTRVWDRHVTWWTPWVSPDADMEHRARLEAIEQVRSAALGMGILKDAERNAQDDIRRVLAAFGVDKVIFIPAQT